MFAYSGVDLKSFHSFNSLRRLSGVKGGARTSNQSMLLLPAILKQWTLNLLFLSCCAFCLGPTVLVPPVWAQVFACVLPAWDRTRSSSSKRRSKDHTHTHTPTTPSPKSTTKINPHFDTDKGKDVNRRAFSPGEQRDNTYIVARGEKSRQRENGNVTKDGRDEGRTDDSSPWVRVRRRVTCGIRVVLVVACGPTSIAEGSPKKNLVHEEFLWRRSGGS